MWRDNEVRGAHGEAVKHIRHPVLGPVAFECSAFVVATLLGPGTGWINAQRVEASGGNFLQSQASF